MRGAAAGLVLLLAGCGARGSRPASIEDWHRGASLKLQSGDLDGAEADVRGGLAAAVRARDAVAASSLHIVEAEILTVRGRAAEALQRLEQAGVPPDAPVDVRARLQIVRGHARCLKAAMGAVASSEEYEAAEHDLAAGLELAGRGSREVQIEARLRLGTCAARRKMYARAAERFHEVIALAQDQGPRILELNAAGSLGVIRMQTEEYDEALEWLRRADALAAAIGTPGLRLRHSFNLGWASYEVGDDDRAREILLSAETIASESGRPVELQRILQILGNVTHRQEDHIRAREYYERSLRLAGELKDRKAESELTANLAALAVESGRLDEAEVLNQSALAMKRAQKDGRAEQYSLLTQCTIEVARRHVAAAEALCGQVVASKEATDGLRWPAHAALAALYADLARPRPAEAEFERARKKIDRSRARVTRDDDRLTFFASLSRFYDGYVDFLVREGRAAAALAIAEAGRARLLSERTRSRDGAGPLAPAPSAATIAAAARAAGGVVLAYWLGAEASYVWMIAPSGLTVHPLPPRAEIERQVARYRAALEGGRDPIRDALPEGDALYRMLVPEAAQRLPPDSAVVIVPDGALHRLSFDALVVAGPRPRYWIEDVRIAYAAAVRLLGTSDARATPARGAPAKQLLLIGDPIAATPEHPPLPGAAAEIAAISAQFAPDERESYVRERALPQAYREAAPRGFRFVHFAAHAVASRARPLDSAVILSPAEGRYKLYARDVTSIPLDAELVTLSACQSAGTRAYSGEGLVGLAWAFFRAGARNVVASQWSVEDASTARVMEDFYAGLRRGLNPPAALREAKQGLASRGGAWRKPFYWAPFIVYVQGRS